MSLNVMNISGFYMSCLSKSNFLIFSFLVWQPHSSWAVPALSSTQDARVWLFKLPEVQLWPWKGRWGLPGLWKMPRPLNLRWEFPTVNWPLVSLRNHFQVYLISRPVRTRVFLGVHSKRVLIFYRWKKSRFDPCRGLNIMQKRLQCQRGGRRRRRGQIP